MLEETKSLYRLDVLPDRVNMLLIEIIDRWRLDEMRGDVLEINNHMIESGQIFQTREGTVMMPPIVVDVLFNYYSRAWTPLRNFISRGIKGDITQVELELFPGYFYAFKIHLYQNLKITSMTMREFFKGAYMSQEVCAHSLVFKNPMSFYKSSESQVNDVTRVDVTTMQSLLDMSKCNVALHIGEKNPYHDFLMSFSECSTLFQGKCMFSDPNTEYSLETEQLNALKSTCELKWNYIVFITKWTHGGNGCKKCCDGRNYVYRPRTMG
jgi:hypothetical protein